MSKDIEELKATVNTNSYCYSLVKFDYPLFSQHWQTQIAFLNNLEAFSTFIQLGSATILLVFV